jgi:hypothetical protein
MSIVIGDHPYAVWAKPDTPEPPPDGHGPNSAAHRLTTGDFCRIATFPKFKLRAGLRFFTIGSCFATHIGHALVRHGFEVDSLNLDVPGEYFDDPKYAGPIALIKFTAHSILNEMETNVLGKPAPDNGLVEVSPGLFWNPQLHKISPTTMERALFVKEQVRRTVSRIVDADVVFITLGLTETWFDKTTGAVVNENPLRIRALRQKMDRFAFRNVGVVETLEVMEQVLRLIRESNRRNARFVLTVSPVPLLRTFTDQDVIVANSYSKSVLRVVAGMLAERHEYVDYFPSYEIVENSPRPLAWRHDQRHVLMGMVDHVIRLFSESYIGN